MKFKFVLIFFLFLSNCGYVPMYSNSNNINFNILIIENIGDRDVNNLIITNLKRFSKNSSQKNIKIKINSSYQKNSIAKDTTGNTTDYEIKISTIFFIEKDKEDKYELILTENFSFKKLSSNFDELEYEKTIKENLVRNIIQKFIQHLSRSK